MARKTADTSELIGLVRKYLGTPYSWGGGNTEGPTRGIGRGANTVGFDCSSLVQWAYAQVGVDIPRVTYDQVRAGVPVPKSDLQPGDIVFFNQGSRGPEHEGLYVGGGKFIEAPRTGLAVRVSDLAGRSDYVTARRVVPAGAPPIRDVAKVAAEKPAAVAPVPPPATVPPVAAKPAAAPPMQDNSALLALLAQGGFAPPPLPEPTPDLHIDHDDINPTDFQGPIALAQQHVLDTGRFDTTAFARAVHAARAVPLPRTLLGQATHGTQVELDAAEPGDLLFFGAEGAPTYQGVHAGKNTFVHGDGTIRVSSLADPRYASSLLSVRRP